MKACLFLVPAFLLSASPAFSAPPTPDEVNRVLDYFNTGKDDGPILLELTPCLKVGKAPGEERMSCLEPVTGPVKKKAVLNAWTRWFVPKDGKYEDLSFQFLLGGEPRETKDLSLEKGSTTGNSAYKAATLSKAGEWEVKVRRGDKVLGSAKVTVTD
jgi:hypothetical protein